MFEYFDKTVWTKLVFSFAEFENWSYISAYVKNNTNFNFEEKSWTNFLNFSTGLNINLELNLNMNSNYNDGKVDRFLIDFVYKNEKIL